MRSLSREYALQLEKRVSFRRAMRKSVDSALRLAARELRCALGRLNGNEIARSEWYLQGRLPLHTLRADMTTALRGGATYGQIGVEDVDLSRRHLRAEAPPGSRSRDDSVLKAAHSS